MSTYKFSPANNFVFKTGSSCSTGSGGIGRGRISKATSGKENGQPEYAKLDEVGDNIEMWEQFTGCPHVPACGSGTTIKTNYPHSVLLKYWANSYD